MRAMYNVSLCYSIGEGLVHSHRQARKWMKRAADRGHSKALFEHGLHLFSVRLYISHLNFLFLEKINCHQHHSLMTLSVGSAVIVLIFHLVI